MISKFAPFWDKVSAMTTVSENGCHLFAGTRNHDGYGRLKTNGKSVFVHREVWAKHFGAIPAGLCVCHKCDVPNCINPEHLFIGTQGDNMRDRANKGRYDAKGEKNNASKLQAIEVKMIRKLLAEGMRNRDAAAEFGVSLPLIEKIKGNRLWAGV
jgi:hypothetical protein